MSKEIPHPFIHRLGRIKNRILASKLVSKFYRFKWYLDTGSGAIGWITTKFQDVAAIIIILGFFKLEVSQRNMLVGVMLALILVFVWGYGYKNLGFYDRKMFVSKDKDPVLLEVYQMAKDYNQKRKEGK